MQQQNEIQHVFLVGAKSLGTYGGYETFVYKLTEYHQNNPHIKYHVACKANGDGCMDETKISGVTRISDTEFEFHNARCFKIHVPQIGPVQAIYYDVTALRDCCRYIRTHKIPHPIVYIMACRMFLNPDEECEIIRGCHNRDKGTAENERFRAPKFIFSYSKNERLIFLCSRNVAQKEISTMVG